MNSNLTLFKNFENNIETYGSKKLKDLLLLAKTEDIIKEKMENILFEAMINDIHSNVCWFDENIFQKNVIANMHLGIEEQQILTALFTFF